MVHIHYIYIWYDQLFSSSKNKRYSSLYDESDLCATPPPTYLTCIDQFAYRCIHEYIYHRWTCAHDRHALVMSIFYLYAWYKEIIFTWMRKKLSINMVSKKIFMNSPHEVSLSIDVLYKCIYSNCPVFDYVNNRKYRLLVCLHEC